MSELVKKSTADFIRTSVRAVSSDFLAGLTKMSIEGGSAAGVVVSTTGGIHSLCVKPFWIASFCLLARVSKAATLSSIVALASYPVIGGIVVVEVVVGVVVVVLDAVKKIIVRHAISHSRIKHYISHGTHDVVAFVSYCDWYFGINTKD